MGLFGLSKSNFMANSKKTNLSFKTKKKVRSKTKINASSGAPKHFPVVCIGASAGGIEAFSDLLKHLKSDLGMAYVLIMHLSPNHKSSLAEIFQPKTEMHVQTAKDGMEIKVNNIYVIPPNAFMSLVDGHLKLGPRSLSSIGNFAIDYFLLALASVYKNNSIGVILSGLGSDGTIGLKAIKAEGGITFAQDDTAKFSSMPRGAYDSGYADFRLDIENICLELAHLAKIPYTIINAEKIEKEHDKALKDERDTLQKILLLVKEKTSIDFIVDYKQASVFRRVVRRSILNKCKNLNEYLLVLGNNEKEIGDLYHDFLINVTSFFRDPEFFKTLDIEVFPAIIGNNKTKDPIRIWVAGCATGEEAYSIAINLTQFLEKENLNISFQIFASDLDAHAIGKARSGIYPASALLNVSDKILKRFFKKIDGQYQIEKSVRDMCIFSQQNLLKDPPFSRIDLISCQNVMIYLEPEPQQKILQKFHYALKPLGYLFLGKSESIGASIEFFEALDKRVRIFMKRQINIPPIEFSNVATEKQISRARSADPSPPIADLEKEVSKILLTRYVSPSVVLNQSLTIIQFFGETAPFLEPSTGKASLNVLKMIKEDLLIDLRALLHQARKTEKIASKEAIKIYNKKNQHEVRIDVIPKKNGNETFYLVVFTNLPIPHDSQIIKNKSGKIRDRKERMIAKLDGELVLARELIKTTTEEYETTFEELQSYNEETLSTNEELQSVNEELETSKEELQAANEELTTINDELQKRNIELKESRNYSNAIVDTVKSPFLVLTFNLQVRSANKSFYETFKIKRDQAEGSYIYELGENSWDIPSFRENLNELFRTNTNFLEFPLTHNFKGVGELVLIVNAYKLLSEDSRENLILLAFINISDVVKTNQELNKLNEHLAQFAFVASHDLQEPLRKIETFSNYLIDHKEEIAYVQKYAEKINSTSSRMSMLLKDLLSYSMLLKNKEKEFIPIDLNETLSNVCKDLELVIEEKSADINIDPLPSILGKPIQINQLFYNLVINAIKFSKEKPVLTISSMSTTKDDKDRFALTTDKEFASIYVKDNGIGFDQKYAEKIFTVFQRLKDKPDVKGSGMGLAICKKIVEDHGGVIFANSKENEGSTFSIILPVLLE